MMAVMTAVTLMLPTTPVQAKSTVSATSSGDTSTSGNNMDTISSSGCSGSQQVSGIDAQVFSQITPDHDGTVVCSKSDGIRTTAEGTSNVDSYHWTAWYKNGLEDDVDRTQGEGNYHGFPASKVEEWKQYAENIAALNGGKFPETKDYVYPTDTSDGKLDFWGDIAGYYSILGDPQYSKIHLQAFQQFSYRVEKVTKSYSYWIDPNYQRPDENGEDDGSSNGSGDNSGSNGSGNNGTSGSHNGNPSTDGLTPKDDPIPDNLHNWITCMQFLCSDGSVSPNYGIPGPTPKPESNTPTSNMHPSGSSWAGAPNFDTSTSYLTYYLGDGYYMTERTVVDTNQETKTVKIADANVGAGAYATEIAAYSKIALQPGSNGTLTYDVAHDRFWKVTPSYWSDGGKEVITNDSSYPYSFTSSSQTGSGVNNFNLYSIIKQRDKFYTVIHGYPDITEIPDGELPDDPEYPVNPPETCVEVDGKETCSKDETPPIDIPIDITEDEVQEQVELDRFVHLTKDQK